MDKLARHAVAFSLVVVLALALSVSATTVVVTEPATPLVDVAFYATPGLTKDSTLFASTSATCSSANAVTPICSVGGSSASNHNSTTCIFTITSVALGMHAFTGRAVPQLYWCSSASGPAPINTLTMSKMVVSPPFVFFNNQTTLTFDPATPVGTRVGFYSTDACTYPVAGTTTVTLGSSLQTDLLISTSSGNTVYVCATVPTVTGTAVFISATTVFATSEYQIFTTTGLRFTNVSVGTNSRTQFASLSTSRDCLTLAQPPSPAASAGPVVLDISAPQGTYYFCTMIDAASGVYVPATSQFVVTEYGIQPRSIYARLDTHMTLTRSAIVSGVSYDAGLFTDKQCTNAVLPWSSNLVWKPTRTGTFYACVRPTLNPTSTTIARAGTVVVSGAPTVSFSRSPGIIGLGLVATITRSNEVSGLMTVGMAEPASSGNPCHTLLSNGTTATEEGTSVSLHIPETAPTQVITCVSNPVQQHVDDGEEANRPYFYPVGPFTLRRFHLTFDSLLVHTDLAIALDAEVQFSAGSAMKLVPSSAQGCLAAVSSGNRNSFQLTAATSSLTPVVFPTAGAWLLCVSEPSVLGGRFALLRTLQVYGDATITPHGLVTGVPTTLAISAIPPSSAVYLTADAACSPDGSNVKFASTTSSASAVATMPDAKYPTTGNLILCVRYRGEKNSLATAGAVHRAGLVVSAAPQVYPSVVIQHRSSKLSFLVPASDLLAGGVAYLMVDTAGGNSADGSATPPSPSVCSTTTAPTEAAYQLSISAGATDKDMPFAIFTPVDSTPVGTQFVVCVGFTGGFTLAGTVRVEEAMTMTYQPATVTAGLPMRATFGGDAFTALRPDRFAVIDASAECAQDLTLTKVYASGAIDGNGNTDVFRAPAEGGGSVHAVTICVAASSSLVSTTAGYSEGGTVALYGFTALSRYAIIGQTNNLQGWPAAGNAAAAVFLAPCRTSAACAAAQATTTCTAAPDVYYTSPLQALPSTTPEGPYVLCQRSTITGFTDAVVGANTTVQVVPAWSLTTAITPIRQYQPFTVVLSGGPSTAGGGASKAIPDTYDLHVVAASVGCDAAAGNASASQSFSVKSSGPTTITITDLEPVMDVVFCLAPSAHDSFPVLQRTLQTYMAPTVIVADTATVITSATPPTTTALAKLSSSAACTDIVSNSNPQPITGYNATFTVAGCGANGQLSTLHYCESTDGGASFATRGRMGLLRREACADGTANASITAATVVPAAAIADFGIRSDFLTNPRLSTSADCKASALLPADVTTLGYSPVLGGTNTFFVCAAPVDSPDTPTFTTTTATLTVTPWHVTPTAVLSRYNTSIGALPSTRLRINFKTPSQQTFISASRQCSSTLISAPGFATAAALSTTVSTTGANGLLYVCTMDSLVPSRQIVVADFLSVTPPNVAAASPAIIRGATYTATLLVQATGGAASPLYSMHAGTDSGYAYASYYVSKARDVFFSQDSCASVLPGTAVSFVNDDNVAAFTTADIATSVNSVQLCTGTPAGNAIALSAVVVAAGVLYPTQFVTGVKASIYIPLSPNTEFFLSHSSTAGDCSAVASTGLPTFTTDGDGYGEMVLYTAGGAVLAPTGMYTLCYVNAAATRARATSPSVTYTPLPTTIEVTPQQHFNVRGLTFFVGVPGSMALLDDLRADYLLSGFATSRQCDTVDDTFGSWKATSASSITVTAASTVDAIYLCARAPANGTVTALPRGTASLTFQPLGVSLPPNDTMNTCDAFHADRCYAPGGRNAPSDAVMGAIFGSCCDVADRANVVGQTTMATSTSGGDGSCSLALNAAQVKAFSPATSFSLCVWSPSDVNYCATLGTISVTTDCTSDLSGNTGKRLTSGELAAIIVCSIVGGLLLIALIVWLVWCCCCRGYRADDDDGYVDMDSSVFKDKQLVALRHMELGECYEGSSATGSSRRHPLMYYCDGIEGTDSQGRTITSNSRARSSSSDNDPLSLLINIEEDQRDAIALAEARERYNLRLACNDGCAALLQAQKEDEVEIGFERDDGSDDDGFARHAVPERREVELIDHEETTFVDMEDDRPDSSQAVDGMERRHLRSCSIESSRPSTPRRRESFLHFDAADEEMRDGDAHPAALHASEEGLLLPGRTPTPRRNLIIFHQTSRNSRNGPLTATEAQQHRTAVEDDSVEQQPPPPPPSEEAVREGDSAGGAAGPDGLVQTMPPTRSEGDTPSPRQRVVARSLDMLAEDGGDAAEDVSSIAAMEGAEDPSAAVTFPMAFLAAGRARDRSNGADNKEEVGDDDDDDDDDDALNYTTTQRYHDELRVLLEHEDSRRQRLSNWEEEERAALAQEELDLRLQFWEAQHRQRRYEESEEVDVDVAVEEDGTDTQADECSGVELLRNEDHDDDEEEDEYRAPAIPAELPALPPAPRSAAAHQQYLDSPHARRPSQSPRLHSSGDDANDTQPSAGGYGYSLLQPTSQDESAFPREDEATNPYSALHEDSDANPQDEPPPTSSSAIVTTPARPRSMTSPSRHLDSNSRNFGGDNERPARVVVAGASGSGGGSRSQMDGGDFSVPRDRQRGLHTPQHNAEDAKALPSPGCGPRYGDPHDSNAATSLDFDIQF